MIVRKIVLTGGPCAGKTTGMSYIQNFYTELGYSVIIVGETATELKLSGIRPETMPYDDFQKSIFEYQYVKEKLYDEICQRLSNDKILIVYDRAIFDGKAYSTEESFNNLIAQKEKTQDELLNKYEAVFHLVTAAEGADDFYNNVNNKVRLETKEEAIDIDHRLIECWSPHQNLVVIDNRTDFEEKMRRLLSEISSFLKEKGPYVVKKKYLIKKPDVVFLNNLKGCKKVSVTHTYILVSDDIIVRACEKCIDGQHTYSRSTIMNNDNKQRLIQERLLTHDQYNELIFYADNDKEPVVKDRYCFNYDNQYYEIDVFPFVDDAILQIKLSSEKDITHIPDFVEVIKELPSKYY